MEPTLKLIKTELIPIVKEENIRYSHINNFYQEILEYTDYFTLNRRKHFLVLRFVLQKRESSLSFNYRFVYNSKDRVVDELYSFADKDKELPGIGPIDKEKLSSIYKFSSKENGILNEIPLGNQSQVIMEVFKNSYKNIIDYAKNIAKIKKIPE